VALLAALAGAPPAAAQDAAGFADGARAATTGIVALTLPYRF
jgi:hypothetical protein